MEISKGVIKKAKKVVIYGPEGIGKSTLAAGFPDPLFVDTEGSTEYMDVKRFERPESWQMIMDEVQYVIDHTDVCRTLIIDTADWAEKKCSEYIITKNQVKSIEDFGYGKGYTYLKEEFGRLLNMLNLVIDKGINVVICAHAMMRKFEQPDELGAYDRWEMKLSKQVSPLVKEWCDMLLFCNYKTMVVNVDNRGAAKGKNKGQGQKRTMYTQHNACWDAKNRFDLPAECPMCYASIMTIIEGDGRGNVPVDIDDLFHKDPKIEQHKSEPIPETRAAEAPADPDPKPEKPAEKPAENPEPKKEEPKKEKEKEKAKAKAPEPTPYLSDPARLPAALRQLMDKDQIGEWDIQKAVSERGYYPVDVLIQDYDAEFIDGCLVAAWDQIVSVIKEIRARDAEEIPFDPA